MKTKQILNLISLSMGVGLMHQLNAMPTIISDGHVDIGLAYEEGAWDLHLHVGLPPTDFEIEPDEGVLYGDEMNSANFGLTVPNANLSFIGPIGTPFWLFPIGEDPGLPFLGIATEEIDSGIFLNDEITLTFTSHSGPGDFFLYNFDVFGDPNVIFDSTDGFGDSVTLTTGSHGHYNFAFTGEGVHGIGLEASGTLNDGMSTFTTSGESVYTFGVNAIPEPETYALWAGVSAMVFLFVRKRIKKS